MGEGGGMTGAVRPTVTVWHALDRLDLDPHGEPHDFRARCPVHLGDSHSLHVSEAADGHALLHCFARGCLVDSIRVALDLEWTDLFADDGRRRPRSRLLAKPIEPAEVIL